MPFQYSSRRSAWLRESACGAQRPKGVTVRLWLRSSDSQYHSACSDSEASVDSCSARDSTCGCQRSCAAASASKDW